MPASYINNSLVLSSSVSGPTEVSIQLPVPTTPYDQMYFYYKARVVGDVSSLTGTNIPTIWNPAFQFSFSYTPSSSLLPLNLLSGSSIPNPNVIGIYQVERTNNPTRQSSFKYSNSSGYISFETNIVSGNQFFFPTVSSSATISNLSFPTGSVETNITHIWKVCKNYSGGLMYNVARTSRSFSDIRDLKDSIPMGSSEWNFPVDVQLTNVDLKNTILSGSFGFNSPKYFIIKYTDPIPNRQLVLDRFCVEWIDSSRTSP